MAPQEPYLRIWCPPRLGLPSSTPSIVRRMGQRRPQTFRKIRVPSLAYERDRAIRIDVELPAVMADATGRAIAPAKLDCYPVTGGFIGRLVPAAPADEVRVGRTDGREMGICGEDDRRGLRGRGHPGSCAGSGWSGRRRWSRDVLPQHIYTHCHNDACEQLFAGVISADRFHQSSSVPTGASPPQ